MNLKGNLYFKAIIRSVSTLLGTPVHLPIHAVTRSANHVAAAEQSKMHTGQMGKKCDFCDLYPWEVCWDELKTKNKNIGQQQGKL